MQAISSVPSKRAENGSGARYRETQSVTSSVSCDVCKRRLAGSSSGGQLSREQAASVEKLEFSHEAKHLLQILAAVEMKHMIAWEPMDTTSIPVVPEQP
jgi:hypothetical protein